MTRNSALTRALCEGHVRPLAFFYRNPTCLIVEPQAETPNFHLVDHVCTSALTFVSEPDYAIETDDGTSGRIVGSFGSPKRHFLRCQPADVRAWGARATRYWLQGSTRWRPIIIIDNRSPPLLSLRPVEAALPPWVGHCLSPSYSRLHLPSPTCPRT